MVHECVYVGVIAERVQGSENGLPRMKYPRGMGEGEVLGGVSDGETRIEMAMRTDTRLSLGVNYADMINQQSIRQQKWELDFGKHAIWVDCDRYILMEQVWVRNFPMSEKVDLG
jgi:hypothetical protein